MCTIFKSAIRRALPRATLIVDHFHLVHLANQTLTEVRRRVTVRQRGRRGRKGNRERELRNRLARVAARMRGEHVDALLNEPSNLPAAIGEPITAAWNAKEDLLDLLATAHTHPDREQVCALLHRFYQRCADADLPELERLATTGEAWQPEILAFLNTGITNAGSKASTGLSRPSPVTPTASVTSSTSDNEPEPPPPAKPAEHLDPPLTSLSPHDGRLSRTDLWGGE
jgi:transposase